jgi:hypothetical protein
MTKIPPTHKLCVGCESELPRDAFYADKQKRLFKFCKECHKNRTIARSKKYKSNGLCISCGKEPRQASNSKCVECWRIEQIRTRKWRNSIMRDCINIYGGKCACCGEDNFLFLSIDHIDNDGYLERRESGNHGGYAFYIKLLKQPYLRHDLQVLCFNCNLGKHRNGGTCPHNLFEKGDE